MDSRKITLYARIGVTLTLSYACALGFLAKADALDDEILRIEREETAKRIESTKRMIREENHCLTLQDSNALDEDCKETLESAGLLEVNHE